MNFEPNVVLLRGNHWRGGHDHSALINIDGVAHYGLPPVFFLQVVDLKNTGLTNEDLAPLFRSAENHIPRCGRSVSVGCGADHGHPVPARQVGGSDPVVRRPNSWGL
jgi:hypothetical protein